MRSTLIDIRLIFVGGMVSKGCAKKRLYYWTGFITFQMYRLKKETIYSFKKANKRL